MVISNLGATTPRSPPRRLFAMNSSQHPPSNQYSEYLTNPWNSPAGLQPSTDIWGPRIQSPLSAIAGKTDSQAVQIPLAQPLMSLPHGSLHSSPHDFSYPSFTGSPHFSAVGSDGRSFQRHFSHDLASSRPAVSSPTSSFLGGENYMDSPPPSPDSLMSTSMENAQVPTTFSPLSSTLATSNHDNLLTKKTASATEPETNFAAPAEEFALSSSCGPLYMVKFKSGRLEIFTTSGTTVYKLGDRVMVDADRGCDLGRIVKTDVSRHEAISLKESQSKDRHRVINNSNTGAEGQNNTGPTVFLPKQILSIATPSEIKDLEVKIRDEASAMALCKIKVAEHGLDMEIVDAEYQWDRRKLTFFYSADSRIDFRDLVRELFRVYRTRIWMCATTARS